MLVNLAEISFSFSSQKNDEFTVDRVIFKGLNRTDLTWVTEYADLDTLPAGLTGEALKALKDKLLSTRVFKSVEIRVVTNSDSPKLAALEIEVEEKWTLIPVVRAQTGGGTPLFVAGTYNTHSFGQYLTLGGEFRKYGDAPPGAVIYGRGPGSWENHPDWGLELWRDIRYRTLYHSNGDKIGHLEFKGFRLRSRVLKQVPYFERDGLKLGFDTIFYKYQDVKTILSHKGGPQFVSEEMTGHSKIAGRFWLMLQFDDIVADNIRYDGIRLLLRHGLGREQSGRPFYSGESELFWYVRPTAPINLAFHALGAFNHTSSVFGRKYLGGFDSVRGLPDGIAYGNKIWYVNAELRYLSQTWDQLWLQSVGFFDAGEASDQIFKSYSNVRSAAGVGLRVIVPKIYRFVIRLDYAWALDHSGQRGFSAGLNHLFQPYRPL